MTKIIQNAEKNRSLRNRQIRESTTKIETQIAQVLCRKASATKIPGKDHWHQTAVTTFTENSPFHGYTRKTTLSRATQIFQKVTKLLSILKLMLAFPQPPSDCLSFKFEILFDMPKQILFE